MMTFCSFEIRHLLSLILLTSTFVSMGASPTKTYGPEASKVVTRTVNAVPKIANGELATFAAGCFWGIELAFQRIPGVVQTRVGYTQGNVENPTYEQVCTGLKTTGHVEAVEVTYQPSIVSFEDLLTVFWDIHDPTTPNRQGGDVGTQYRSGIYYHTEEQHQKAIMSRDRENKKRNWAHIVTEIIPNKVFYPAELYHQKYLEKGGQCSKKGDLTPIRCYG